MSLRVYWLVPLTGASAEGTDEAFLDLDIGVTCPGPNVTAVSGAYGVDWSIWGKIKKYNPLRIAQRNDGNGIAERHSRIRNIHETSSSDDSNRVGPWGKGSYR